MATLLAVNLAWLFYHRRWYRTFAMVALTGTFLTPPTIRFTANALGLQLDVPGQGWAATVALVITVSWLGFLEASALRKQRRWATFDALGAYLEMVERGCTKEEKRQKLRIFAEDDAVDDDIFQLCQIAELSWPDYRTQKDT